MVALAAATALTTTTTTAFLALTGAGRSGGSHFPASASASASASFGYVRRRCLRLPRTMATTTTTTGGAAGFISPDHPAVSIEVRGAGEGAVNGNYLAQDPGRVPAGFARTCAKMRWDPAGTWRRLSNGRTLWFEKEDDSYVYFNRGDAKWWIDGPDGLGVYIVEAGPSLGQHGEQEDARRLLPPASGWEALSAKAEPAPTVAIVDIQGNVR